MLSKIGIFGGAFNPPHFGHLILAQQAYEELNLNRILFVPTGMAPHRDPTDPLHRVTMTKRAVADDTRFHCSYIDAMRKGASYMIETLRILHHVLHCYELCLIVGEDHADLPGWKDAAEIKRRWKVWSGERTHHSSSEIRARAAAGLSVRYYVPESVYEWIKLNRLYCYPKTNDPQVPSA